MRGDLVGGGQACGLSMYLRELLGAGVVVGSLNDASPEELAEMMGLARRLEEVLADAYHPDGINLGMNLGRSAGAGGADRSEEGRGGKEGRSRGAPRH